MSAARFYREIMRPAAAWCEVAQLARTPASDVLLLAIAGMEAAWKHRAQISVGMDAGPARSFWQMERGGGVSGVLMHSASRDKARALCAAALVEPNSGAVWRAIEGHDGLAYGWARLLVWTDAGAMPETEDAAWACYLRCWRPGAYARGTADQRAALQAKWSGRWAEALGAVTG